MGDRLPGGWIRTLWLTLIVMAPGGASTAQTQGTREWLTIPSGLDAYLPVPPANPLTASKVALGRSLFFDPILSRDSTLACAGCHDPEQAFTDGTARSTGVDGAVGRRSAPTLVNRVYGSSFFWDGREPSLEAQVLRPIQDPAEMDMTLADALTRLETNGKYRRIFQDVFERRPNEADLAMALASYVRTILAGDSPVDRYYSGDGDALSPEAREGIQLFRDKANCSTCHVGPNFSDERFHITGMAWRDGTPTDSARYIVTGLDQDIGAFKTPTLREIARTAPYMHDGSLQTLEEVVDFYDQGGHESPYLDQEIRPLHLSETEKRSLLAFLRSLTGTVREGLDSGSGG